MPENPKVRPTEPETSAFLADILAQPELLRRIDLAEAVAAVAPLARAAEGRRIVLTGMGGSHVALRPLWLALAGAGRPAWLVETSELLGNCLALVEEETLVIAASQSGRSAEIVVMADAVLARGARLLALTNDLSAPLAGKAHVSVDIRAGKEAAVSTKTFVNTLAAAVAVERALLGGTADDAIARTADAVAAWLGDWRSRLARIKGAIGLPERLVVLGRGPSLAAAEYGALVAKEAAKRPVEALGAAEFRHGPMELSDDRLTALVIAGPAGPAHDLNRALARDVAAAGGRVHLVDTAPADSPFAIPDVPPAMRPIAESLPFQLLAIALAEASGVEPGVFRHLEKVTTVL